VRPTLKDCTGCFPPRCAGHSLAEPGEPEPVVPAVLEPAKVPELCLERATEGRVCDLVRELCERVEGVCLCHEGGSLEYLVCAEADECGDAVGVLVFFFWDAVCGGDDCGVGCEEFFLGGGVVWALREGKSSWGMSGNEGCLGVKGLAGGQPARGEDGGVWSNGGDDGDCDDDDDDDCDDDCDWYTLAMSSTASAMIFCNARNTANVIVKM
jgi:hypothetical protein